MTQSTAGHVTRRKTFLELAAQMYDQMHAPEHQAQLVTFTQREDRVVQLGQKLQTALLEEHLQRDPAAETGGVVCCPTCRQPSERQERRAAREIRTRVGKVRWARARYYCRHCRRHFSPSRLGVGTRSGGV